MTRRRGLALPLCVLTALLIGSFAEAQNLLSNGTFDTDVSGWSAPSSTITLAFRGDTGSTLPGGSDAGCLEVSHAFWNGSATGPYQQVAVTAGASYTLAASYWVPTVDNTASSAWVDLAWLDTNGFTISWYEDLQDGDLSHDTWSRMSGTATAPSGVAWARVWLRVGTPAAPGETRPGVILYDDVSLTQVTATETTQSLFVPAGAAIHGQAGTYWSTDGWFSNLTDQTVSISGAFLRQGQDNTSAVGSPTALGTVPPKGFAKLDDLATMLGVSEATGGIYLRASATGTGLPAELVKVTSHTFTPNPYGGGVYGQGIPAAPAGTLATSVVPGVFQGSELRTNVGALNTSSSSISLNVTILNTAGNQEASTTWTLQPFEQRQVSLPSLGLSNLTGGTVVFELQGNGSYRGYTSTVDQNSGDAVYNEAR